MSRTRAGDGEGEQDRYGYTRSAEKQKEDACKERVFPRLVQNGTKVVGKEGATGHTRFKILTLAGDLHEGCLRVTGEICAVKLRMDLHAHAVWSDIRLRVEEDVPLIEGKQKHIVRRRLGLCPRGRPNRLKHRVGIRQVNDAVDRDAHIAKTRPVDDHGVPWGNMKIGRRLLGNQHAFDFSKKETNIAWEIADVGPSDP